MGISSQKGHKGTTMGFIVTQKGNVGKIMGLIVTPKKGNIDTTAELRVML